MKEFKESYLAKIWENSVVLEEGLKPSLQLSIPDISEFDHSHFNLASGADDELKSLLPVNGAKFLILEYDQDISIKLNNDTNTAISLNVYGTPAAGKFFLMSAAVTSIYFTNSSGNTAKIKIFYGY